jgi:hypothetical protein
MLSWSPRRHEKPGHPEQPFILASVGIDPANPDAVVFAYRELQPVPYAAPEELHDDVIEPTAVFRPWPPYTDWDNIEVTVEYYV